MRVKLWGVRGSLPSPELFNNQYERIEHLLEQYLAAKSESKELTAKRFLQAHPVHEVCGYGGNTACAEITSGNHRLLIDAGSGLQPFAQKLAEEKSKETEFHIFFTHFHWDHLLGLPFFSPIYNPMCKIHCYAVQDDLEPSLKTLFKRPNFPVPYEVVKKQIVIHKLAPYEKFNIGNIQVAPYQLDHPDPCWGARVEADGKALAWCVDTECTRTSKEELGRDIELYQGADLMVFDAQYTFGDALEKRNWGHSSAPVGIDLAVRENVKEILFMHHDPSSSNEMINQASDLTNRYYEQLLFDRKKLKLELPSLKWRFATEGEEILL